jgi:hypothetical protein
MIANQLHQIGVSEQVDGLKGDHSILCEAIRGVETAAETRTTATTGEPTDADRQRFWDTFARAESSP